MNINNVSLPIIKQNPKMCTNSGVFRHINALCNDVFELSTKKNDKDCDYVCLTLNNKHISIELDKRYKNGMYHNLQEVINAAPFVTNVFSKKDVISEIKPKFDKLQKENPQKAQYVAQILKLIQIKTKTEAGVSDEYTKKFIEKLMDMDIVLLKNIYDNKIPISIYDDLGFYNQKAVAHAMYIQSYDAKYKELQFCEKCFGLPIKIGGEEVDTVESMAHEFGHAYDYNNGKKLNLTRQQMLSTINDDKHLRLTDLVSMSKEFDEAFVSDFNNMLEIDRKLGKPQGSTFEELLQNQNFSYYLGAKNETKDDSFNDINARKELYAQMVSYVTTGKVTNKEFQKRIEELFPNLLNFTKSTLQNNIS